jgi:UDP-N-acetylglucosamine acyltransferase
MNAPRIHPTAIVESGAELDTGVEIGPYAIVGARVRIGRGTRIGAHCVVEGRTTLGADNQIFHHASVGTITQDLKYRGEDSELVLGDRNIVREFATLNLGTQAGGMITRLGHGNLIMNYCHIAHDCVLGNANIVANGAQLGGHVIIEDFVFVGALAGVHQFVRIGESAILGAGAMVSQDVPPFCNATGDRARLYGLNSIGLKRRGFEAERLRDLKRAYRIVFHSRLKLAEAAARVRAEVPTSREVEHFLAFLQASSRGVCRSARQSTAES